MEAHPTHVQRLVRGSNPPHWSWNSDPSALEQAQGEGSHHICKMWQWSHRTQLSSARRSYHETQQSHRPILATHNKRIKRVPPKRWHLPPPGRGSPKGCLRSSKISIFHDYLFTLKWILKWKHSHWKREILTLIQLPTDITFDIWRVRKVQIQG